MLTPATASHRPRPLVVLGRRTPNRHNALHPARAQQPAGMPIGRGCAVAVVAAGSAPRGGDGAIRPATLSRRANNAPSRPVRGRAGAGREAQADDGRQLAPPPAALGLEREGGRGVARGRGAGGGRRMHDRPQRAPCGWFSGDTLRVACGPAEAPVRVRWRAEANFRFRYYRRPVSARAPPARAEQGAWATKGGSLPGGPIRLSLAPTPCAARSPRGVPAPRRGSGPAPPGTRRAAGSRRPRSPAPARAGSAGRGRATGSCSPRW